MFPGGSKTILLDKHIGMYLNVTAEEKFIATTDSSPFSLLSNSASMKLWLTS